MNWHIGERTGISRYRQSVGVVFILEGIVCVQKIEIDAKWGSRTVLGLVPPSDRTSFYFDTNRHSRHQRFIIVARQTLPQQHRALIL